MPSFLTQCPHCLTPFRVTDTQLEAADGLVRCGACLGVFSAAANRITLKPTAAEAATRADIEEHADPEQDNAEMADDPVATAWQDDETQDDASLPPHGGLAARQAEARDTSSREQAESAAGILRAASDVDEASAEFLDTEDFEIPLGDMNLDGDADLDAVSDQMDTEDDAAYEDEDELDEAESEDGEEEYDAEEDQIEEADELEYEFEEEVEDEIDEEVDDDEEEDEEEEEDEDEDEEADDDETDQDEEEIGIDIEAEDENGNEADFLDRSAAVYEEYLDEEPAEAAEAETEEAEQAEEFEPEFSFEEEEPFADADEADVDEFGAALDEEAFDDDATPVAPAWQQPAFAGRPGDKAGIRNYLADIDDDDALDPLDEDVLDAFDEPVMLDAAPRRSRLWGPGLLLANLLLAALLAWQYTAANIDRLSSSPRFATLLPYLCRMMTCPTLERSQPELFVSEQLLVRSHPRYAEALEVSLVFRNEATQPQPFPALELGLHDTNNRLLANRLFQPAEYLPAELQTSEMPAQSSLQVTLELVDPGSEAVNYTLAFRAP